MQPQKSSPMVYEAEEDPAMSDSTTDIRIVPLPTGDDVLTEVLPDGARRMLAQPSEAEHEAWSKRSLKGKHYVYVWADGVHFNIRLEGGRQCILVLMGRPPRGRRS